MENELVQDGIEILEDPVLEDLLLDDLNVECKYTVGVTALYKTSDSAYEEGTFLVLGIFDDPDTAVATADQYCKDTKKLAMISNSTEFGVTVEETLMSPEDSSYVGTIYRSPVLRLNEIEVI